MTQGHREDFIEVVPDGSPGTRSIRMTEPGRLLLEALAAGDVATLATDIGALPGSEVSTTASVGLVPRAGGDGKLSADWIHAGDAAAHAVTHESGGSDELDLGALAGNLTAAQHGSLGTGDPHPQYATDADLTAHVGAADPHPAYQRESEKGVAGGYAGLGVDGLVPDAQLPAPDWADITSRPSTFAPVIGSGAGDAVAGNDARLSAARTPLAHTHTASQISDSSAAGRAVLTAADAAAQRTALGLGTAAVTSSGAYATAAQGTTADAAAAKAANLSDLTNAGTARSNLGLGSAAVAATTDFATAAQGADARTPTAHASSHLPGGSDALTTATAGASAMGDVAAVGVAASFARSDHTHGREMMASVSEQPVGTQTLPASSRTEIVSDNAFVIASPDVVVIPSSALLYLRLNTEQQFASVLATVNQDTVLIPGAIVAFDDDPLVLSSGAKLEVPQDALLWTDAPRAPQFVSQLLWITA